MSRETSPSHARLHAALVNLSPSQRPRQQTITAADYLYPPNFKNSKHLADLQTVAGETVVNNIDDEGVTDHRSTAGNWPDKGAAPRFAK